VARGLYYWQSDYDRADTLIDEAHGVAAALGDGFFQLATLFFGGLINGNQGRTSDAVAPRNRSRLCLSRSRTSSRETNGSAGDTTSATRLEPLRIS
jgi:hypothetical protein